MTAVGLLIGREDVNTPGRKQQASNRRYCAAGRVSDQPPLYYAPSPGIPPRYLPPEITVADISPLVRVTVQSRLMGLLFRVTIGVMGWRLGLVFVVTCGLLRTELRLVHST